MRKKIVLGGMLGIAVIAVVYFFVIKKDKQVSKYTFAEVKKGNISTTITSTGTLDALSKVDVGTQVSGRIDKIYVDFNSNVKRGQLLAILDTTALSLQVSDANAQLQKSIAQYDQAKAQYENNKVLHSKGFLSELDFINSKASYEIASASVNSAKTSLERAKTNLRYAFIYSPISGKIINRNVQEGQTVAASLSAPTLFTIAENLSKMQILASVDESDIGSIKDGQKAEFTVQAFPDKKFYGKVVQIRLDPQVVSNVVNYTVVINADNDDKLLLPGMTATIDFYIQQRDGVILIPNAALRFQPSQDVIAQFTKSRMEARANIPDSIRQRFRGAGNFGFNRSDNSNHNRNRNFGRVWYLDKSGKMNMAVAVLGITDGRNTELLRSRNIIDGMKVITGSENNSSSSSRDQNVLNSRRGLGGMRRGF